jgi:hypothetical protein
MIYFFLVLQFLSAYPSDKICVNIKMSMEQAWRDTNRGKRKFSEKTQSVSLCSLQISRGLTWD